LAFHVVNFNEISKGILKIITGAIKKIPRRVQNIKDIVTVEKEINRRQVSVKMNQ
jgi:hypothetical protein